MLRLDPRQDLCATVIFADPTRRGADSKFTAKVENENHLLYGLGLEEIGSLIVSFSCPYEYRGVVEELAQLCELVSRSKAEASG
jgi:hypothetical protein